MSGAFERLDANKDGVLSREEMGAAELETRASAAEQSVREKLEELSMQKELVDNDRKELLSAQQTLETMSADAAANISYHAGAATYAAPTVTYSTAPFTYASTQPMQSYSVGEAVQYAPPFVTETPGVKYLGCTTGALTLNGVPYTGSVPSAPTMTYAARVMSAGPAAAPATVLQTSAASAGAEEQPSIVQQQSVVIEGAMPAGTTSSLIGSARGTPIASTGVAQSVGSIASLSAATPVGFTSATLPIVTSSGPVPVPIPSQGNRTPTAVSFVSSRGSRHPPASEAPYGRNTDEEVAARVRSKSRGSRKSARVKRQKRYVCC